MQHVQPILDSSTMDTDVLTNIFLSNNSENDSISSLLQHSEAMALKLDEILKQMLKNSDKNHSQKSLSLGFTTNQS